MLGYISRFVPLDARTGDTMEHAYDGTPPWQARRVVPPDHRTDGCLTWIPLDTSVAPTWQQEWEEIATTTEIILYRIFRENRGIFESLAEEQETTLEAMAGTAIARMMYEKVYGRVPRCR